MLAYLLLVAVNQISVGIVHAEHFKYYLLKEIFYFVISLQSGILWL